MRLILHISLQYILLTCLTQAQNTFFGCSTFNTGFTGYLYNLKADSDWKKTEVNDKNSFYEAFGDLIRKKFSDKALSQYQIADEANDLKYLNIPSIQANDATNEFGSSYIDPTQIIMVYKGRLESAPKKRIRFGGLFDDAMCVLVNGKLVFYVSRHEDELRYKPDEISNQRKEAGNSGVNHVAYGEYVSLKKGDEITLVLAEVPGGNISGRLYVQEERHRYDENSYDDPILHPFLCSELDKDETKELKKHFETEDIPIFEFVKESN